MTELAEGHARSTAPPAAYFDRWVDHASWHEWSPDTEWVRVDGEVRTGATGVLKPKGGPKVRFVVSTCDRAREYTDTSLLPGARLVFEHTAVEVEGGCELAVHVRIAGPLSPLWRRILGRGLSASAQGDLDRLVALVESS